MPERRSLLLLAGLAALAGCEGSGGIFSRVPPAGGEPVEPAGYLLYLETMRRLGEADPATQAELFAEAEEAHRRAPTTTHTLRLALALATPGHPASDPQAAQQLLSEVLATPETLLPQERVLAEVALHEVEQRLVLEAEIEQLQRVAEAARTANNADQARRLEEAVAENRRLKQALAEAEAKLEAVTSIEQSIIQRSENGDQNDPGNP